MKGIQEVYNRTEEEKRRLELESQLYKRWRPASSTREENILLSSRSNNEALAKMNWLDKQVTEIRESSKIDTLKNNSNDFEFHFFHFERSHNNWNETRLNSNVK